MKKSIFAAISVFLISNISQAIVCTATAESINDKDKFVSQSVELVLDSEDASAIRYKADMGSNYYFVQGNKIDNSFLLMITLGPKYTEGATASMTWDTQNRMRLARVDGYNVYKLSCVKAE